MLRAKGVGKGVGERHPASAGGMGEAGSAVEMGRLEAPDRDKPGIDRHQRRVLRPDLRDTGSVIKKCSAAGWLRVTKRRLSRCGAVVLPQQYTTSMHVYTVAIESQYMYKRNILRY